jgi:UDP-N-acetylglucosamine acyltransferase
MNHIHNSAIIHPNAKIGANVRIGAYCVVGEHVELGDGVELYSHVCIDGRTKIGANTKIFPFASLGFAPQDLKYHGEPAELIIGERNVIREHVTMNIGTEGGGMVTQIGNDCLFMVAVHVAHDCVVGNRVIMANNATLAGHVQVGDGAVIGGLAAVHQFVRIGEGAMIGGMSGVEADVIPYGSVVGERANLAGLNLVGLKRKGLEREAIHALRGLYRELFEENVTSLHKAAEELLPNATQPELIKVLEFIASASKRSFCVPK